MKPHVFKLAAGLMWMKVSKGKRVVGPERSHDRASGFVDFINSVGLQEELPISCQRPPPGGSSCVIKTQFVHHGNSKSLHFISLIILNIGNSDVTNQ